VTQAASIEETLALWAASLREIKQRIRSVVHARAVLRRVRVCSWKSAGDEQRKTGLDARGGGWPILAHGGSRHSGSWDWDADAWRDIR